MCGNYFEYRTLWNSYPSKQILGVFTLPLLFSFCYFGIESQFCSFICNSHLIQAMFLCKYFICTHLCICIRYLLLNVHEFIRKKKQVFVLNIFFGCCSLFFRKHYSFHRCHNFFFFKKLPSFYKNFPWIFFYFIYLFCFYLFFFQTDLFTFYTDLNKRQFSDPHSSPCSLIRVFIAHF